MPREGGGGGGGPGGGGAGGGGFFRCFTTKRREGGEGFPVPVPGSKFLSRGGNFFCGGFFFFGLRRIFLFCLFSFFGGRPGGFNASA
ncbi:MAG: hypothetical protein IPL21_02660 [Saprospirales bacterium]|nr:hypothetical protein [Saprospirales bacterium]